MSIARVFHNNQFLLIPGTAEPQRNDDGEPIPDPTFGTVEEIVEPDPPPIEEPPAPTKAELLAKVQELLTAIEALA